MAKAKSEPRSQRSAFPPIRYLQETQNELRKVTWPSRDEAFRLTGIVLIFVIAAMIFLGLLDGLFSLGIGKLVEIFS